MEQHGQDTVQFDDIKVRMDGRKEDGRKWEGII